MSKYIAKIGLEMHCEISKTKSKVFSSARNTYSDEPNSSVRPLDMAFPGTLPVVNKEAVRLSLMASMIMHFLINGFSTTVMMLLSKWDENAMQEALGAVENQNTLGSVIRSSLPMAVIGTIFAVVVYRLIAANEGRLQDVDAMFGIGKNKNEQTRELQAPASAPKTRLFTVPLAVGVIMCTALMILNEIMP